MADIPVDTGKPALSRIVNFLAIALATFFLANGAFMLVSPENWYWAVPGVPETGPYNQHFVRDIALIYLVAGGAVAAGLFLPAQRVGLWSAAAAWHMGHAFFHFWEVAVGICGPDALGRDFAGVTLPSVLTLGIAIYAYRAQAVTR